MNKQKIGWAGLGNMGNPMVKNLLKAGYPVEVYNRTRQKEQEVIEAGAKSAAGLQELAAGNDLVFVMVSDDAVSKEIFSSEDGLLAGDVAGKLFINVSTVSPETSRHLDEQCRVKGAGFLEAPVSGSVKPAQDGTLIMLVGGNAEAFEKAKPALDVLGKMSVLLGAVGTGASAKLAVNYFLALNVQGLAEAVQFAQTNGVKPEDMLNIINEGAVGSAITKLKTPSILSGQFPAAFALKHMAKDLRLAKEQKLISPLSTPVYESFKAAQEQGLGDEDLMAVYKYLAK
ncbi:NAD(P)-dependent oxidoreductase [Mucilaginibacter terrae]|uniref:3-hydroxyisobutyrate dehydrogenase n=1 Tax=Mucilaginibacter terrae TaxID=1955052 RepID=A0ABU3GSS6_9SPHI|nr:NAD(P)-dependent oxidoreductase [Mucilaginibacter terrae]MDT3402531.1 3-hydroxyisobutyrate dehydrogenase [Mucilaginibacter terrae]